MATKRNRKPSNAVSKGTAAGTIAGALIEAVAAAHGLPMPPGSGAALGGVLTGLFAYIAHGGRKGEPH